MTPKRILIFSLAYTPFEGGAELAVRHITDRLAESDYVFDMLTLRFDSRLPKVERVGNVTVYRLGFSERGASIADTFRLPLSLNKYWFPCAAAWRALSLHRKHRYDATWSLMANYAGFGALFFKLARPRVPFILTLQEGDPIEHIVGRVGFLKPFFRKIFTRADRIQAISRFLATFAEDMGARSERIVVVPNGVPIEEFGKKRGASELSRTKSAMGKKRTDQLVISTSRLVHKNAIDTIIRALPLLPPTVKLAVLGDGPAPDSLQELAQSLGVAHRVAFLSAIAHDALPAYLQAADVFVRPSRSEGLGSSFLEAMAAEVPVVATPVGGIPDFLEHEVTGLFCEVDDPASLAERVALVLQDKVLRAALVKNAQKLVVERYDWAIIARRMREEVFFAILQKPSAMQ